MIKMMRSSAKNLRLFYDCYIKDENYDGRQSGENIVNCDAKKG